MEIGIIGAGTVGVTVARRALEHGHRILLSARRSPITLVRTTRALGPGAVPVPVVDAAAAELVVLAVPWLAVPDALADLPPWNGRILVDATNPFVAENPLRLADLGGRGASEIVAGLAPGARVVKAFNSLPMSDVAKGPTEDVAGGTARRTLFVSGDDADATGTVAGLIDSFGYAAVVLGGLTDCGPLQQAGGPLAGLDLLLTS